MNTTTQRDSSIIMEELIASKHGDATAMLPLCQELHNYAITHNDSYADAFSLLYFSIAYLRLCQLKPCIDYGQKGHAVQSSCKYIDLLQLQDNILGCAFSYRGDFQSAMIYFYEGIHYASKNNDIFLLSALYSNTAELYRLAGANNYALEYAEQAQTTLKNVTNNSNHINFDDMQFQIDLLQIHFAMGNHSEVESILLKCHELLNNQRNYVKYASRFFTVEAQIRYQNGEDFISIFPTIKQALSSIDEADNMDYFDAFWSYYDAVKLLYTYLSHQMNQEQNSFDDKVSAYCITQLNQFYAIALHLGQAYFWILYDALKIQFYELLYEFTPDHSAFRETCKLQLLSAYQHYYEQCMLRDGENNSEQLARLKDTLQLHKTQEKNTENRERVVRLKLESEQDVLTKCANRYGLQNFVQTYFNYVKENKKTFACCIIDIDYFKQYNDTYGHLAGDKCIKMIADTIRCAINEEGFLVRYGGDEFVLLFIGKANEEIIQIAANIKTHIEKIHLPHATSKVADYVTISMGIVNCIPDLYSHSNDFLHAADNALYEVKKTSKNNFHIVYEL